MIKALLISIIINSVFLIGLVGIVLFNSAENSYAQKKGTAKFWIFYGSTLMEQAKAIGVTAKHIADF